MHEFKKHIPENVILQAGMRDNIERKITEPRWYTGLNVNSEKRRNINGIKYTFQSKPEQA